MAAHALNAPPGRPLSGLLCPWSACLAPMRGPTIVLEFTIRKIALRVFDPLYVLLSCSSLHVYARR